MCENMMRMVAVVRVAAKEIFVSVREKFMFIFTLYEQNRIAVCRTGRAGRWHGQRPRRKFSVGQRLVRPRQCRAWLRPHFDLFQRAGSRTDQNRKCATGNFSRELGRVSIAQRTST